MELLLCREKLQRIKALSGLRASGFIHVECFNTHIQKSVLQILVSKCSWTHVALSLLKKGIVTP